MTELPSVYTPETPESKWYEVWEKRGLFGAAPDPAKRPFTIVIPPPNVTGSLHMGHALNNTLQDVLVRRARMKGFKALWVPGTDHGGIATQNVVEKILKKEGKTRHDLGRAAFLERMWAWRKESGDAILHQLRKLGSSLDWTRTRFTMDEKSSRAVQRAFVDLHQKGKVYLGKRLVNWCARCGTALSDIEVEYVEQSGHLWHIRYPLADGGDVVVATTRPETMLGDTAVAVHPEDPRYADKRGKTLRLPLRRAGDANFEIPLVFDAAVDKSFGSGAVKVTPAHDATDADIGGRHKLASLTVIGFDGKMTAAAGTDYAGLSVKDARAKVLADLEAQGFLVKVEPHKNNVSTCYRCATVIEPLESSQWFVKTQEMASRAAAATREGRVKIHPESWAKPYLAWLDNNKDWCVSRQIWWGHQIPIWYCRKCAESNLQAGTLRHHLDQDPEFKSQWTKELLRAAGLKSAQATETRPAPCADCGGADFIQDPDVLDTWFSSGLWPLTTLGWPDANKDLDYFYPTSVLATGHEILYLWVARMVMMGLEFRNEVPYRDVFIHGIVRDKQGRKMSKSLNNVIDPLDVMKKFGTDALRFALVTQASPGRDMQMADDNFVGARNFANKVWNASRFVMMNLAGFAPAADAPLASRAVEDRWIAARFAAVARAVDGHMDAFDPAQAARALYGFFWNDFCDWYIEMVKPRLSPGADADSARAARQTLAEVLDGVLHALHPFMPFITEELWQALWATLGRPPKTLLMEEPHQPLWKDLPAGDEDQRAIGLVQDVVSSLRTIRSEMNVPPGKAIRVAVNLTAAAPATKAVLKTLSHHIAHLGKLGEWKAVEAGAFETPPQAAAAAAADFEMFIPLEGLIDFEKEKARLEKEKAACENGIARDTEHLANPDFRQRAPAAKVAEVETRLAEGRARLARLGAFIKSLSN
ncbi:MAG: valine--tRNA ligase [Elusimicrobia bacterium]|jgi:valyl-tRNA synthetase|nr:valine--tRNA ligase [Elusimicrobiota bacterium]MBK7208021.1 valine--tRNA ligase [Elusimicrobiota bacterium]MBK7544799.1 valine--tRNA ligase [Elusimicrobiota bacterium]MBK7574311.1 valine--tRNA ligase [Elusimicrobiota bacterium]MBK7688325.1 valine--tRNA ligase [Elusimicrobiota bacterium]